MLNVVLVDSSSENAVYKGGKRVVGTVDRNQECEILTISTQLQATAGLVWFRQGQCKVDFTLSWSLKKSFH